MRGEGEGERGGKGKGDAVCVATNAQEPATQTSPNKKPTKQNQVPRGHLGRPPRVQQHCHATDAGHCNVRHDELGQIPHADTDPGECTHGASTDQCDHSTNNEHTKSR